MNPIPVSIREIKKGIFLHIINISILTPELKIFIDDSILEIYSKGIDSDIDIVKLKINKFLIDKKDSTLEIGYIAEFFIHLYLNQRGFLQECLFKNLESSNDIKKGFDGYYSKDNEEWIMESKSGNINTKNISHKLKVQESYTDLLEKITGVSNNNPWENACSHALLARSADSIYQNIKKLSDNYTKKKYAEIKDFNIIPCSTIFLDGKSCITDSVETNSIVEKNIIDWIDKKIYKNIDIICITQETKDIFLDYLTK